MKAVIAAGINHDNPLSVLDVRDMPEPEPRLYWSTVSVKAATVNHHDLWSLQGVGLAESQTPMILGTDAAGTTDLYHADFQGPTAIVIGSEGFGMSRLVAERCDLLLSIPMKGQINSLNASSAAAVLLYEAVRQRMG